MATRLRYREGTCALCALLALIVAVAIGRPVSLDGPVLDVLVKSREIAFPVEDRPEQSPVVVIALDRRSLDAPELARYPRALMGQFWAALMDDVFQAGARAIGFDLIFSFSANQISPNLDAPFLGALHKHRERVVLARTGATLPALPFLAALQNDEGALGIAEISPDADGRYRQILARNATPRDGFLAGLADALLRRANAPSMPGEVPIFERTKTSST
jgi:adenylate cyclase